MTDEEMLKAHEQRIQFLEKELQGLDKRLDVVEQEQITIKAAVEKLTARVEKLASSLTTALDRVKKAILLIGAVAVVGIIVTIVQDSTTKQEIIGAITNITGAVIH